MKKGFFILASVMLVALATNLTVFAHGGHGGGRRGASQPQYAVCTVENCEETGIHMHDGEYYCCPNHGTGHGCGGGHNR